MLQFPLGAGGVKKKTRIIAIARTVGVSNVSEIERLAARVAEFSSKADFWNNGVLIFLIVTALAAAGIVICQRLAFVRAGQMASAQSDLDAAKEHEAKTERDRVRTELATAETKAKEADARIAESQRGSAEANERALEAQHSLASAEQHAKEADAKAEGFRLNIAKANESAEEARAQVAAATAEAAKANLELAKLKTPRTLSVEQQNRVTARLRRFAGQRFDFNVYPDSEPMALATIIDSVLKAAGWERIPSQSGDVVVTLAGETAGTAYLNGVQAFVGPDDKGSLAALEELAAAMSDNGIPCAPHKTDQLKGKTPAAILIAVGNKPQS